MDAKKFLEQERSVASGDYLKTIKGQLKMLAGLEVGGKELHKGDRVLVKAAVSVLKPRLIEAFDDYGVCWKPDEGLANAKGMDKVSKRDIPKGLVREMLEVPVEGILVGYTFRTTGFIHQATEEDDITYLIPDMTHKLFCVQPLASKRWLEPLLCLLCDMAIVTD